MILGVKLANEERNPAGGRLEPKGFRVLSAALDIGVLPLEQNTLCRQGFVVRTLQGTAA
jgi:hypothetical protein